MKNHQLNYSITTSQTKARGLCNTNEHPKIFTPMFQKKKIKQMQFVLFSFFLLERGYFLKSFYHLPKRKKSTPQYCFHPFFLFSEKNFHLFYLISFFKKMKKKLGHTSLCRYLWSSVMLAGPEKVRSFYVKYI